MLKSRKKIILISLPVVIFAFFATAHSVFAQATIPFLGSVGSIINLALGAIMNLYVSAVGFAVLQVSKFLISIATYNNFVNQPSVVNAWALVRDVANMVLVLALLVIAFATIFGVQKYSYKQLLPRLLAMSIAINFSRTIAGLMIDFGQVFMLTFVNAWAGAAGGNFINALKLREILQINPNIVEANAFEITVGYLIAGAVITVTLIVLLAFSLILTLRIVTLWMLIVMAPIVFALSAWPSDKAKKHYGQWWDQFVDNIVVGPAVAFFLWLTLATIGGGDIATGPGFDIRESGEKISIAGKDVSLLEGGAATAVGNLEHFASYIIGIGMMVGALKMVQDMRVVGAKVGGEMLSFAQKKAKDMAYKYTGARAVKERYDAFQAKRESKRKESVEGFANKAFGVYGNVQAAIGRGLSRANVGKQAQDAAGNARARADRASSLATTLETQAAAARAAGNTGRATDLENRATIAKNAAASLNKRANILDKVGAGAKIAQGIGAVLAAPLTGGLSGLALAPLLGPKIAQKGAESAASAQQWKDRKVSSHLDALKDEKRDVIDRKAAGVDVSDPFEQMAAIIKKAQEGWFSSAEIPQQFQRLQDLGADRRILSRFGSSVERKYESYKTRDPSGALNQAKIEKAIIDGDIDLGKLRPEDLLEGNGLIPALVAKFGTDDQWKKLTSTKGSKDATRNGLIAYQTARLDFSTGKGMKLDASGKPEAYDDDTQKSAERAATIGAGIDQTFGYAADGNFDPAKQASGEASVLKQSFTTALQSKRASGVVLSVKASQIGDTTTGVPSAAGNAILQNLSKAAFAAAAKKAFENEDAEQMASIKAILDMLEARQSAGVASPNELELYEHARGAKKRNIIFDNF